MKEYIMAMETDIDGVDCYIRKGELIRCKDCKRWATDDGMFKDIDERQWHHCPHLDIDTEEYFYCSEAKRKD